MVIHPRNTKSVVTALRQKQNRKNLMLKLTLDTNITEQVREYIVLGLTPAEELKWQSHINNVCKQLETYFCLASLSTMPALIAAYNVL